MFHVAETVSINCSPDDAFAFVADLRNFPLWRANLASSEVVSERPTDVGARCKEEIQMGPRKIAAVCEITSYSAGQAFSFRAVSPGLVYDGRLRVDPAESATSLTLSGDVRPTGFLRLLQPVLKRRMQAGVDSEVAAIKARLENAAP